MALPSLSQLRDAPFIAYQYVKGTGTKGPPISPINSHTYRDTSPLALNSLSPPPSPASSSQSLSSLSSSDDGEVSRELRDTSIPLCERLTKFFKESKIPGAVAISVTNVLLTWASATTAGPFAAFDSAVYGGLEAMATVACVGDPEKKGEDMWKLFAEMVIPGIAITGLIAGFSGENDNWDNGSKSAGKYAATLALSAAIGQVASVLSPLLSGKKPQKFNVMPSDFDDLEGGEREEKLAEQRNKEKVFKASLALLIPAILSDTGILTGQALPPAIMGAGHGAVLSGFGEVWKAVCDPEANFKNVIEKVRDLCVSIPVVCAGELAMEKSYPWVKKNPLVGVASTTAGTLLLMDIARFCMNTLTSDNTNPDAFHEPSLTGTFVEGFKKILRRHNAAPAEASCENDGGSQDNEECNFKKACGQYRSLRDRDGLPQEQQASSAYSKISTDDPPIADMV